LLLIDQFLKWFQFQPSGTKMIQWYSMFFCPRIWSLRVAQADSNVLT
jgi:hypothetical protein